MTGEMSPYTVKGKDIKDIILLINNIKDIYYSLMTFPTAKTQKHTKYALAT